MLSYEEKYKNSLPNKKETYVCLNGLKKIKNVKDPVLSNFLLPLNLSGTVGTNIDSKTTYNCGKLENLTYPQLKFNFNTELMALIKEIAESRRQIIKNIFEATICTSQKP